MPPDTGPSLDTRQPAESQFLGTSRKVAVPPLHPLFSLQMQFCITCTSPPPGVLKQSLSIRLPAESQIMPTGCRFKVQGGPLTDRPWGGGWPSTVATWPWFLLFPQFPNIPGTSGSGADQRQIPECCRPRSLGFTAKPKRNSSH